VKIVVDTHPPHETIATSKRETNEGIIMNSFDKQLKSAIETYAHVSGMTEKEIMEECSKMDGPIYRSVVMIMFGAY
jgi:hypothetical protein